MADLIDRDAVLHDVSTECSNAHEAKYYEAQVALTRAKKIIRDAPAVNRWIPVEDALPDSTEDVLVWFEYFRYGEYDCLYQTYGIGNYSKNYDDWIVNHETGWDQLRVIAWMPLPEPPEKE